VDERGIPPLGLDYVQTEALVVSSFAVWPAAMCADSGFPSISVQNAGPLGCVEKVEYNPEGPNSNAVIFQTQKWSHDPVAIGVTTVSFDPDTGRIVDADIEINLTNTGLDFLAVRYVVAHEAGHFFGLDHSALDNAVMFAQTQSTSFAGPPALTTDDVNAICLAYPTYRPVNTCDFEPERGYSSICGGDVTASCAMSRPARRGVEPEWMVGSALIGLLFVRKRWSRKSVRRRSPGNAHVG
jgi:hypothetical protein